MIDRKFCYTVPPYKRKWSCLIYSCTKTVLHEICMEVKSISIAALALSLQYKYKTPLDFGS